MDKQAQQRFFDKVAVENTRKSVRIFYVINQPVKDYYESRLCASVPGKRVLDYGCGNGSYAFFAVGCGAEQVVGIDISPVLIEQATALAQERELENIAFCVMDAEEMEFESASIDVVCGGAILHHLRLDGALREVSRILTPEGRAIFIEPLGYNPAINLFRKLTPQCRVEDEHPLKKPDLKLIKKYFQHVDYRFFHLFTLLAVLFHKTRLFPSLLDVLSALDKALFKLIPLAGLLAWQVVIVVEGPVRIGEDTGDD